MAKNSIGVDFNGFAAYAEKIEKLGGDLKPVFEKAMLELAETTQNDTTDALADGNLPAGGKYHGKNHDTENSLIEPHVTVSGSLLEVPLGFDYTKPGAGGWLITGTPRMRPDMALNKIYRQAGYMNTRKKELEKIFQGEVNRLMGG